MGFNDLMHPRNIYRNSPPDFKMLGEKFDYFRKHTKETKRGRFTLNFKDSEALRALTCALLEHDFGLKISIPLDRLIPTVPLRLNYILWIEDLLSCLSEDHCHSIVRGFDIGSGASCIYPLLGAKLNNWHFLATEVDDMSVSCAMDNVKCNGLENNIKVKQVTNNNYLKKPIEEEVNKEFDFCMCNPPFFKNEFEASHGVTRSEKRPQPSGVCTGTETETVAGGGEVEFVKEIIKDSLALKEQISWYTTMLGKKSSLAPILAFLKENDIKAITTTEFCQGHTMRWGVAWTFLPDVAVQESPSKRRKKSKRAKPLQLVIPDEVTAAQGGRDKQLKLTDRVKAIVDYVRKTLDELEVAVNEEQVETDKSSGVVTFRCHASDKTWAHQRRKRREILRKKAGQEKHGDCRPCSGEEAAKEMRIGTPFNVINTQDTSGEISAGMESFKDNETFTGSVVSQVAEFKSQEDPSQSIDTQQGSTLLRPLLSFLVRVGAGSEIGSGLPPECVVLELTWVDGPDKNDLYQLYQYFQNKLVRSEGFNLL